MKEGEGKTLYAAKIVNSDRKAWVFEIHAPGDIGQTRLVTGVHGYQMLGNVYK
jgi:hypothetical protein